MSSGALSYKGGHITANWTVDQQQMPLPFLFEDFIADRIAEDSVVVVNQSGTPLTAAAIAATSGAPNAGAGGWIVGKTDDVDAEIDEVALGAKPWMYVANAGQRVIIGEVGLVIPTALTARQYFFGLTDSETEGTGTNGSLNIQTGTTVVDVATDAAGFIFSSLSTAATHWQTANTKAGTQAYVADTAEVGVVDQYTKLRVEIDTTGAAFFYAKVGSATDTRSTINLGSIKAHKAAAVATTALLLPLFAAAPTTTTGVEWELDYLFGAVGNA